MVKKPLVKAVEKNRNYEITYLVGSDVTSSELATLRDEVVTLIGKNKGTIKNTEDWGKKDLAYPIKKAGKVHKESTYTHLLVTLPTAKVQKLARELELKKGLLRHLIVQVDQVEENN